MIADGLDVAEAVNAPRVHFEDGAIQAEPGIDEAALERLEAARLRGRALARAQRLLRRRPRGLARPGDGRAARRGRPAARRRCRDRLTQARRSEVPDDDLAVHLRPLGDLARAVDGVDQGAEGVRRARSCARVRRAARAAAASSRAEARPARRPRRSPSPRARPARAGRRRRARRARRTPRAPCGRAAARLAWLGRGGLDRLDLPGRVVGRLEAVEDAKRPLARDDDVQAAVVEALGHLGDARLAADPPGAALVVAKDDPERLLDARGSARSSACSAPRRCAAAAARRGAAPAAVRRSAARRLRPPSAESYKPRRPARMRARWRRSTSRPRGCSRAWRARPATRGASCSTSSSTRASASMSCAPRSPRTGSRCCRSSGCSAAAVSGSPRAEVAERAGVERGVPRSASGGRSGWRSSDDDAAVVHRAGRRGRQASPGLRDSGVPDEGVLEVARLMGMTMSQLAAANRRLIADAFMQEGDTEYDVATRFAEAARAFMPLIGDSLSYVLALHLREQIRHDAFDLAELSSGPRRRARTRSPSASPTWSTSRSSGRRSTRRRSARSPAGWASSPRRRSSRPVRLVKLIGDAAMIVGPGARPGARGGARAGRAAADARARTSRCCAPASPAGGAAARGRLVRAAGEPREPDHRDRPARQRARLRGGPRRASDEAPTTGRIAGSRKLKGIDGSVKLFAAGARTRHRRNN